jgi:alkanesulfonate monooxygenase SsuD/methylene tetrahydromethanopterin reductase-like flavin-dependent oxidoreductase (luciferase family)
VTVRGKHYQVVDASLRMHHPRVPIWIAASGPRMLDLAARYASGWNGGGATRPDGEPFRSRLEAGGVLVGDTAALEIELEAVREDPAPAADAR